MNASIWLLTATWAVGQPMPAPAYVPHQPQVIQSVTHEEVKPGLFPNLKERLQRLVSGSGRQSAPCPCNSSRLVPATGLRAQPAPQGLSQISYHTISPAAATSAVAESAMPQDDLQLKKGFSKRIGAAEDYSWITGQLYYLHVNGGGVWVVRYAPHEMEDRYGGSVVLNATLDMSNFREGDLVCVHGQVLGNSRATKQLGGPAYRVEAIDMIERAD